MKGQYTDYYDGEVRCTGYVVFPPTMQQGEKRPAVLICPAWFGQDDFARGKAEKLAAEFGYIGFTIDMYGDKKHAKTSEEAAECIRPFMEDRQVLRGRLIAALNAVRKMEQVDAGRLGVMGYCFGGACALELARSGEAIRGAVSFHGLLRSDPRMQKMPIRAAVLALHGYVDPLVSQEELAAFQQEMEMAEVDWQLVTYGHTMHAFTNPETHIPEKGLEFNRRSSERAWQAMALFFKELFELSAPHSTLTTKKAGKA